MTKLVLPLILSLAAQHAFALENIQIKSMNCSGSDKVEQIYGQHKNVSAPLYLTTTMASGTQFKTLVRYSTSYKTGYSGPIYTIPGASYQVSSSSAKSDVESPFVTLGFNIRTGIGAAYIAAKESVQNEKINCEIELF